eukprot:GHVT01050477.1.p1 GENE.GHVT01050477.1~~GHVT01050477.1.p1  ORF type:complete len:1373 (+),score=189.74 GHVT01050477.1:895-5013(+)
MAKATGGVARYRPFSRYAQQCSKPKCKGLSPRAYALWLRHRRNTSRVGEARTAFTTDAKVGACVAFRRCANGRNGGGALMSLSSGRQPSCQSALVARSTRPRPSGSVPVPTTAAPRKQISRARPRRAVAGSTQHVIALAPPTAGWVDDFPPKSSVGRTPKPRPRKPRTQRKVAFKPSGRKQIHVRSPAEKDSDDEDYQDTQKQGQSSTHSSSSSSSDNDDEKSGAHTPAGRPKRFLSTNRCRRTGTFLGVAAKSALVQDECSTTTNAGSDSSRDSDSSTTPDSALRHVQEPLTAATAPRSHVLVPQLWPFTCRRRVTSLSGLSPSWVRQAFLRCTSSSCLSSSLHAPPASAVQVQSLRVAFSQPPSSSSSSRSPRLPATQAPPPALAADCACPSCCPSSQHPSPTECSAPSLRASFSAVALPSNSSTPQLSSSSNSPSLCVGCLSRCSAAFASAAASAPRASLRRRLCYRMHAEQLTLFSLLRPVRRFVRDVVISQGLLPSVPSAIGRRRIVEWMVPVNQASLVAGLLFPLDNSPPADTRISCLPTCHLPAKLRIFQYPDWMGVGSSSTMGAKSGSRACGALPIAGIFLMCPTESRGRAATAAAVNAAKAPTAQGDIRARWMSAETVPKPTSPKSERNARSVKKKSKAKLPASIRGTRKSKHTSAAAGNGGAEAETTNSSDQKRRAFAALSRSKRGASRSWSSVSLRHSGRFVWSNPGPISELWRTSGLALCLDELRASADAPNPIRGVRRSRSSANPKPSGKRRRVSASSPGNDADGFVSDKAEDEGKEQNGSDFSLSSSGSEDDSESDDDSDASAASRGVSSFCSIPGPRLSSSLPGGDASSSRSSSVPSSFASAGSSVPSTGCSSSSSTEATPASLPAASSSLNAAVVPPSRMSERVLYGNVLKVYCTHNSPNFSKPWSQGEQEASTSTGWVHSVADRQLLTNAHSVHNGALVMVRRRGDHIKYTARVLCVGHECDLALMTVDEDRFWDGLSAIEWGPSPALNDKVMVAGYPLGGDNLCVTQGVVSRKDFVDYSQGNCQLLAIQIDAAINEGNSGGPAVDQALRCVGIAFQSMNADADNIGYIIPRQVVDHFLQDFKRNKKYTGFGGCPFTWQSLENRSHAELLSVPRRGQGILLTQIDPTSPASKVLRSQDILLSVNGSALGCDGTVPFGDGERVNFEWLLRQAFDGERVVIEFLRRRHNDGRAHVLTAELDISIILPVVPSYLPEHHRPEFLVIGGVVFVPLTEMFLATEFGSVEQAPAHLSGASERNFRRWNDEQLIVVASVFAHDITMNYDSFQHAIVQSFNGKTVRNLRHFAEMVDAAKNAKKWSIQLEDHSEIAFQPERARKAMSEIRAQHQLVSDRHINLAS